MAGYLGLDKIVKAINIIKANGGIGASLYKLYRIDTLKVGTLVGEDVNGNKYYEDDKLMLGRNRWVVYHPKYGVDYDPSSVSAEWFGWLHHKTDQPPTKVPPKNYPWIAPFQENVTGTEDAYTPYTTTKPKIEAWVPPKKQ
ncbi:probable NADH dehydrogenase [ubiquinone] 1 alpha subcomplex subunit 12 [Macrobrachium rosenbergii]|uniref:probable NADH dehydrogenase [ubiquinone] 1 alpha subcomplex subunit 12 n=1 Tax=Macrobrachium rosenbergii TaxID=79674 RepID=UPI0034D3A974